MVNILDRVLDLINPDRHIIIYEPDKKTGLIELPNGFKIKANFSSGPLGIYQVVQIGDKFFCRRPHPRKKRKWVRDPFAIEFENRKN